MTRETQWRSEWDVLRAERSRARRRWRSAADELAARARDPLGIGRLVRNHPVASTGIGATVGALLAKLFLGARASPHAASTNGGNPRPASPWSALLREAAIGVAVPWLLRMLKQKFGWDLSPAPAPETPEPAAAPATDAARS